MKNCICCYSADQGIIWFCGNRRYITVFRNSQLNPGLGTTRKASQNRRWYNWEVGLVSAKPTSSLCYFSNHPNAPLKFQREIAAINIALRRTVMTSLCSIIIRYGTWGALKSLSPNVHAMSLRISGWTATYTLRFVHVSVETVNVLHFYPSEMTPWPI
jgi:hypothetical protein